MPSMQLLLVALVISVVNARPQLEVPDDFDPDYPEENPGLFEGDIELDLEQEFNLRNAIGDPNKLWPNGVVHWTIDQVHSANPTHVKNIKAAMQEIMDKTMVHGKKCIEFRPRTQESTYIQFTNGTGCHTAVGYRVGHMSAVTLGRGCLGKGTIMHEVLHALGFWHEQSRADRDNYVRIHFDNIKQGHQGNFAKYPVGPKMDLLNEPYDYASLMHYGAYAFAIDRSKVVIETLQPGVTIGHRTGLSDIDIKDIQIRYGCIPRPGSMQTVPPQPIQSTSHPIHQAIPCSFEHGLCHWTQSKTDDLEWTDGHGRTPSAHTGPSVDHYGSTTGHYLYLEASHHIQKTAKLDSPTFQGGFYCLSTFYHMYGAQTGYLAFNVVRNGHTYTVKKYVGDHGDKWLHMRLSINTHTTPFQFQVEGHTGNGIHSDIAIDDLTVTPGRC